MHNVLNSDFTTFENDSELDSVFGNTRNFANILQTLLDGYTMDELENQGIRRKDIEDFEAMLKESNLTVENAKAINQYSNGSNMILAVKRDSSSREKIKQGIFKDLSVKLKERGISEETIKEITEKIDGLDYQNPTYENYKAIREVLGGDIPKTCISSINKSVKDMNSYYHIDETIEQLDDGLSKAQLPCSMKLYRAVKVKEGIDPSDWVGQGKENKGYTSTSPLYDASFAKYDEYETVMELYVPKGTRGIYVVPFSDYDNVEQEVLLNPNDVYFTEIQKNVTDKNGKDKTILKAIALSKEKECYKEIAQETELKTENNSNLPKKQNRFQKWFSQLRGIFVGKNMEQTNNSNLINDKKLQKESWELDSYEKERIQKESEKIAKEYKSNTNKTEVLSKGNSIDRG